jgi:DNA-binding NtrC family response regulator
MAVVMCLSTDDTLSQTRRMILESAGHRVLSVKNVPEAERACAEYPVDVAVIGQGVPRAERVRVFDLVRKHCPNAKVLELYRPSDGKALTSADAWLEVPVSVPPALAQKVSELASS